MVLYYHLLGQVGRIGYDDNIKYFERSVTADKRVDSSASAVLWIKRFQLSNSDFSSSFNQSLIKGKLKKIGSFNRVKEIELTNILLERLFSLATKKGV